VLYDPAAIPADTPVDPDLDAQDPTLLPARAMQALAGAGAALILHIDEEDGDAAPHAPSGTLKADGLEFPDRGRRDPP
jgi:hypothetical protein